MAHSVAATIGRGARSVLLAPIVAYQRYVSPALPRRCKYYPTCSDYAIDAIREVGILRGSILAAWRLVRCNPFSHGGYDPVENRPFFKSAGERPGSKPPEAPA
jgi:putative membrane protein insertion efficiency factor